MKRGYLTHGFRKWTELLEQFFEGTRVLGCDKSLTKGIKLSTHNKTGCPIMLHDSQNTKISTQDSG